MFLACSIGRLGCPHFVNPKLYLEGVSWRREELNDRLPPYQLGQITPIYFCVKINLCIFAFMVFINIFYSFYLYRKDTDDRQFLRGVIPQYDIDEPALDRYRDFAGIGEFDMSQYELDEDQVWNYSYHNTG